MLRAIEPAGFGFKGDNYIDSVNRETWLAKRRRFIGASDTAGILGYGYADQSPATVWQSKVSGGGAEFSEAMLKRLNIGRLMEPTLRNIFTSETGFPCVDAGEFRIYCHDEISWMGTTLDGKAMHPLYGVVPVELKNVGQFERADWVDGGDGPLKFVVQVQHQICVTGASHGYLFGLIGGNEPIVKLIPRNQEFIDAMVASLRTFWGYVEANQMPPVDDSEATGKMMAHLWPQDTGETVELPADATDWDQELITLKLEQEKLKNRRTKLENEIKASIGDATFGALPHGGRFSWKRQTAEVKSFTRDCRVLRRLKR